MIPENAVSPLSPISEDITRNSHGKLPIKNNILYFLIKENIYVYFTNQFLYFFYVLIYIFQNNFIII